MTGFFASLLNSPPTIYVAISNCWYPDQRAHSLFIRSMRTGPRHWRARGHREITWSFSKVSFKFPKCFVSRLFQFFFLVLWISNGYLWWYLWVDSASCTILKTFCCCLSCATIRRYTMATIEILLLIIVNWVEWLWNPSDSFVICFCGPESAQRSKEFLSFWLYWPIKKLH